MSDRDLWLRSGIAGMAGILCYVLAIALRLPDNQLGVSAGLLLVSAWPLLSIVYSYGLCHFVAVGQDSAANRLAFALSVAAFSTVLAMIVVQLTVGAGIGEIARGLDEQTARALRRGLRLIDLGLDVAWDLLIGTTLIFWGAAMRRRAGLGLWWALPSVGFGMALIALNAATFPTPPADAGLFDIGPFIAFFMFVLAGRLVYIALRRPDLADRTRTPLPERADALRSR